MNPLCILTLLVTIYSALYDEDYLSKFPEIKFQPTADSDLIKNLLKYFCKSLQYSSLPDNSVSLVYLVRKHRLEGYLYPFIRQDTQGQQIVLRYLNRTVPFVEKRQAVLLCAYSDIQFKLKDAGVAALPLKSIAFALEEGTERKCRIFDDIDFIVAARDADSAIAVLRMNGFFPQKKISFEQAKNILLSLGSVNFIHESSILNFDLHIEAGWRYFPRPICYKMLLPATLSEVSWHDDHSFPLDKVNHAIVILYAGTKDLWPRINSVLDLTALLASFNETERSEFITILSQYRLLRFLGLFQNLQEELSLPSIFSRQEIGEQFLRVSGIQNKITKSWVEFTPNTRFSESFRSIAHIVLLGDFKSRCYYILNRTFVLTEKDLRTNSRIIGSIMRIMRIVKKILKPLVFALSEHAHR